MFKLLIYQYFLYECLIFYNKKFRNVPGDNTELLISTIHITINITFFRLQINS